MYYALYRKYRPLDFSSVVGQDPIVKTLKNSIINMNYSHAYMFFGPRGTGKTTLSKIFARAINCLNSKDGEACGKCDSCINSFSNDCIDIIEIDAASNNGVDEIRELRNKISLVPSQLKYKVYIIDEVHMLSIGAFNALLKTLEEPPEHAIFILATTDPQKVPDTIVSRCQCFSFMKISQEALVERLNYVCKQEKIKIEKEVIDKIALLSDGGLRDALGFLDKMVSYTSEKITMSDFNDVNGYISDDELDSFINDLLSGSIDKVLVSINNFNSSGKNLIQIVVQLINYIRNVIVDYYLKKTNINYSIDLYQDLINLFNENLINMKKSDNTKIYFEMLILKFINDKKLTEIVDIQQNSIPVDKKNSDDTTTIISNFDDNKVFLKEAEEEQNIEEVEESVGVKKVVKNSKSKTTDVKENNSVDEDVPKILNIDEVMKIRINNTFATATKPILKNILSCFEKLRDYTFDQDFGFIVCSLLDGTVRTAGKDSFIISYESDALVKSNLSNLLKLENTFNKINDLNYKIAIISDEEWDTLKEKYIENYKNNISYDIIEEPELIFEESNKNDIISSSAVELFGSDIVEVE